MLQVSKTCLGEGGNITCSLGNCSLPETTNFDFYKLRTLKSDQSLVTCLTLSVRQHNTSAPCCTAWLTEAGSFYIQCSNVKEPTCLPSQPTTEERIFPNQGCTQLGPTASTGQMARNTSQQGINDPGGMRKEQPQLKKA